MNFKIPIKKIYQKINIHIEICRILVYNYKYTANEVNDMFDMKKVQEMTDVIHTSISYSGLEHAVISTPIYNRLHRVLQSSLVFLTFPSNKVKRFEHSIGVMHLAGMIFYNSMCNADKTTFSVFMEKISNEIIKWRTELNFDKYSFVSAELRTKNLSTDILKANVPESAFYNKYYPKNLKKEQIFAFYVTFQAVRLAGLLHDVGHLPYSHILEHALKKMYSYVKNKSKNNKVESQFLDIMHRFAEGNDEIHEEIGKLLVGNIRNSIVQSIVDRTDPDLFFFLASFDFAEKIIYANYSHNTIFSDLHLITSSIFDADRLDYCSRDAFCSGTNKSIYPYDRVLTTFKLEKICEDGASRFYFCPSVKSISSVEDLLRRRKDIFSEINFHHKVHKHEVLLEEVISAIGIEELKSLRNITNLPFVLPLKISSIWQLISKIDSSNDWPEYQIIQLDDSWLDTLLKHNFFEKYAANYLSLRTNGNDILWNKFDELISGTKHYHSLLKRASDFIEFDKLFFNKLYNNFDKLPDFIKEKIPPLETYNKFYNTYHSFIFNYCVELLCITDTHKERFFKNFQDTVLSMLKNNDNIKINDCLLRSCMFSFGYKTAKAPLFFTDESSHCIRIEQISSQLEIFQKERAVSPIFHLYYLPSYNIQFNVYEDIDKTKFINLVTDSAIHVLINFRLT